MEFFELKNEDEIKVRILNSGPIYRHHHVVYDHRDGENKVLCVGESCPICKLIKKLRKPWYVRAYMWVKRIFAGFVAKFKRIARNTFIDT